MVPLMFLLGFLGLIALLAYGGLAAERQPAVRAVLRRIDPLTHAQRGRLGVWIARDSRVPAPLRFMPITAFVYWVTPIDLIPDPIPRIGFVDDRIVLALAIWCVARWAPGPLEEHLARIEFLHEAELARQADASASPDTSL